MKILFSFLTLALLFGCNSVKKSTKQNKTFSDSSAAVLKANFDLTKTDSSGNNSTFKTVTKSTAETFKEKITVKEFFSDEFGFNDPRANEIDYKKIPISPGDYFDTPAVPQSRLLYREVVKEREGNLDIIEKEINEQIAKSKVVTSDIGAAVTVETHSIAKGAETTEQKNDRFTLLPPWLLLLLLAIVILIIYRCYKHQ